MPLNIEPSQHKKYTFRICDPHDVDRPWHNSSDAIVKFTSSDIRVWCETREVKPSLVFVSEILLLRLKPQQKLKTTFAAVYRSVRSLEDAKN